ncbi:hypothetical protein [Paenibacillus phytorum]|uniref:hypothetical protein n=1 Tax=Paenibacillus phytorum TaxID=2654977 RepID=UPI001490EE01|nr:hypothetical protein [Paenibacillus phytorum]
MLVDIDHGLTEMVFTNASDNIAYGEPWHLIVVFTLNLDTERYDFLRKMMQELEKKILSPLIGIGNRNKGIECTANHFSKQLKYRIASKKR